MSRLPYPLPFRDPEGHKGTFGKVFILAGSLEYSGAARLCAAAALRGGAGLVRVGVPAPIWGIAAAYNPCYMAEPLPADDAGRFSLDALLPVLTRLDWCDVLVLGPGLGRGGDLPALVGRVLDACRKPVLLDADGLVAGKPHILKTSKTCPILLTPHEGEFLALGGDISKGREMAAKALAARTGAVIHLKGRYSLTVSPDGAAAENPTGHTGLAKGGSGDVLSGLIGSLMAQGMPPFEAAADGAYILGLAAERLTNTLGVRGMTPEDVLRAVPETMAGI